MNVNKRSDLVTMVSTYRIGMASLNLYINNEYIALQLYVSVSILPATSAKNVEWSKDYMTKVFVIGFAAGCVELHNCYAVIVKSYPTSNKNVSDIEQMGTRTGLLNARGQAIFVQDERQSSRKHAGLPTAAADLDRCDVSLSQRDDKSSDIHHDGQRIISKRNGKT